MGIDLEYESDKNLLRSYLNPILQGKIMKIPPNIRKRLKRADLISNLHRGRTSALTKRGDQMFHEIMEERRKKERT